MQAIPRDTIETAVVDGDSRVRTFFSVTVPMLRPTLIFVIITSTIGGLQIFDEPRMFDTTGQGGAAEPAVERVPAGAAQALHEAGQTALVGVGHVRHQHAQEGRGLAF